MRRKEHASYGDLLRLSHDLYRHARSVAPDGPSSVDREADAAVHQRVGESLRAVTLQERKPT
jgi:hypothetical protein